jgi:hypothetical protein
MNEKTDPIARKSQTRIPADPSTENWAYTSTPSLQRLSGQDYKHPATGRHCNVFLWQIVETPTYSQGIPNQ